MKPTVKKVVQDSPRRAAITPPERVIFQPTMDRNKNLPPLPITFPLRIPTSGRQPQTEEARGNAAGAESGEEWSVNHLTWM